VDACRLRTVDLSPILFPRLYLPRR